MTADVSPGEHYLVDYPDGVRVIFRGTELDANGSVVRSGKTRGRWLVEDAPAQVRRDILEHGSFTVRCAALPPTDGVYYVDLCPLFAPPDACGDTVSATGSFVLEIDWTAGKPAVRARSQIQVTVDHQVSSCR